MRRGVLGLLSAIVLAGAFVPSASALHALTLLFVFAIMAAAWNLVAGLAGVIDLGLVGFFGLGGYATGLLVAKTGLPFAVAWITGGLLCVGFAILMALALRRFPAPYFAVATLAASFALREVASNWTALTGGDAGLSLPPQLISARAMYFLMVGLLTVVLALTWWIGRHRPELVPAYAAMGWFVGLVGGAFACWTGFLDPAAAFDLGVTVEVIAMAVVGGVGTVGGPLAGAAVLTTLSALLNGYAPNFHLLALALLIALFQWLAPKGLMAAATAASGYYLRK